MALTSAAHSFDDRVIRIQCFRVAGRNVGKARLTQATRNLIVLGQCAAQSFTQGFLWEWLTLHCGSDPSNSNVIPSRNSPYAALISSSPKSPFGISRGSNS